MHDLILAKIFLINKESHLQKNAEKVIHQRKKLKKMKKIIYSKYTFALIKVETCMFFSFKFVTTLHNMCEI